MAARDGAISLLGLAPGAGAPGGQKPAGDVKAEPVTVNLTVNGTAYRVSCDATTTLLDALRDRLHLTGTKKGCDRGECGACTVHVNGRRVNSCLTLAVMNEGVEISTIEGVDLNPAYRCLLDAFVERDALQCGFCTPGQIMSALALIVDEERFSSPEEIREFMSGNLCRCAAYPNIVDAIRDSVAGVRGADV
jgi:xanthine dehydrogenase YagT iron-sulfur-binding subunit